MNGFTLITWSCSSACHQSIGSDEEDNIRYYVYYQKRSQIKITLMATESICSEMKKMILNGEHHAQYILFTIIGKAKIVPIE